MGIHLAYISTDEVFYSTSSAKIVVNDLANSTLDDKAKVNDLLMLEVGEAFDNVPRCSCGEISMAAFKGVRCKKCDTVVEEVVSSDMDNKMWVRAPEGVPALMNPMLWYQLQTYLARGSKFDLLLYLTDPNYKMVGKETKPIRRMLDALEMAGLHVRGYQHFYDNFDTYIRFLLTEKVFSTTSKNNISMDVGADLLRLFMENREIVWQQYIQVPNRALTIVENSNGKRWIDPSTPVLLKAVRLMVGIDNIENEKRALSYKTRQSRAARFLTDIGVYYAKHIFSQYLGTKHGEIRKHVIATRSNFTGRFVVTAIEGPHDYDEVHFPWVGFMGIFGPHIRTKLYHKYKLSNNRINQIMMKYQRKYHPDIHKIMLELIDEARGPCGKRGISVLINRNPSLKQGSIVLLRLTDVKVDVRDMSASTSGTIAAWYNGDYDGDQETFQVLLDNRTAKAFEPFAARYSVTNLTDPFVIDGVTSLPKQTTMKIATACTIRDTIPPTSEQINFMCQFAA